MKYGFKWKNGARFAVHATQIASLFPALFVVLVSLYPYAAVGGPYGMVCDLSVAALPRWMSLSLSLLYRLTKSEVAMVLSLLAVSLLLGIVFKRLLEAGGQKARLARIILLAACGADLILRLYPFSLIAVYGWGCAVFGFLFRAAQLALILWDFIPVKKASANGASR